INLCIISIIYQTKSPKTWLMWFWRMMLLVYIYIYIYIFFFWITYLYWGIYFEVLMDFPELAFVNQNTV
ncbi:hypothetical protein ACMBCM_09915, partial [Spiroplasma sp. K1]